VFSDMTEKSMTLKQYNGVDGGGLQLFGTTVLTREQVIIP